MPQGNVYSYFASGNILVSQFVKMDTANPHQVVACSANTDYPVGVSQEGAYLPPIPQQTGTQYAAIANVQLRVYGQGCQDVLLSAGSGGWTAGDSLTSDANGAGVTASSNQIVGAIALETRSSGDLGRVQVTGSHPYT